MDVRVDGPLDGTTRWVLEVDAPRADGGADDQLESALRSALDTHVDGAVELWIREVDDASDAAARRLGFVQYRDLWQLRCRLPNAPSGLLTRAFTLADLDDFIGVNNRAFHWHPEQGGLTREQVLATMQEPWFDADGFRLLHDHDGAGELIGFCWTKIHPDETPPLGEIYVIAIDPSAHGRGLGKPMTLAGLEWLTAAGLEHGMLYVESDNDPANATYAGIGFTRHHTNRAYRLDR
ncbi:MAG: mycothiol synthase [Acidimicrobiales bacterium]|nr:mycothiol synthase [Acidimicrobiales bacterium]